MFLININSFPTSSPDGKTIIIFADYTTHIISPLDTTKNNLASQIEETLLSAEDYCKSINLKINKTISQQTLNFWKFPHFKQLHQLTSKKLLGGIYDQTPKLESAPTYQLYKKLSTTVFTLRRMRQITNRHYNHSLSRLHPKSGMESSPLGNSFKYYDPTQNHVYVLLVHPRNYITYPTKPSEKAVRLPQL